MTILVLLLVLDVGFDNLPAVHDPDGKNIHVEPGDAGVHEGVDNPMAVFALPVEFSTVQ